MKGWKEKKSKLVQWISDLTQSQYNICFGLFIVLGVSLLILALDLFFDDSFHIDKDSARYLLSALVQSQAAIVAIVVTLTLVAIQLVVSSYSLRAIDIFKKIPMWWFLACYGASIFYGLFVLGLIHEDVPPSEFIISYSISLESCIYFAYWFGFVTFALLIVYMGEIFIFLEPSNIIERLSDRITKENVVKFIESIEKQKDGQTQLTKDDPVQPIMDIIHSSVMKYDIATTRCGLRTVTKKAVDAIHSCKYLNNEDISMYFCDHLGRVGRYAVSAGDDESAIEIVKRLEEIGKSTTEMSYGKSTEVVAQHIEMIGIFAAEKKLRFVACDAVESLEVVGEFAAQNRLEDATSQVIDSLGNVGMYAAENKIGIAAQYAAKYLGCVGECAAENELENAAKQAVDSLGVIGEYAVENKLKNATEQVAESFGDVGKAAAEKGFEDAASQAAASLGGLGKAATEKELGDVTMQAAQYLMSVGRTAAKNKLDDATSQAAASLGDVGTSAAEKGLEDVTEYIASYLRNVGETAVENGLKDATSIVAEFLGAVGTAAAEKGLERAVSEAAWSLRFVGITAAKKGFGDATEQATWSLRDIGRITAEKGLEDATKVVVRSLGAVGTTAIEKELKFFVAAGAARFLAELTISSEEVVNSAMIQESKQEESDRDSLQKFMKLYEQRLEELRELRTRKPN